MDGKWGTYDNIVMMIKQALKFYVLFFYYSHSSHNPLADITCI